MTPDNNNHQRERAGFRRGLRQLTPRLKLHHAFIILFTPVALFLWLVAPPGNMTDEAEHFWRAESVALGQVVPSADGNDGEEGQAFAEVSHASEFFLPIYMTNTVYRLQGRQDVKNNQIPSSHTFPEYAQMKTDDELNSRMRISNTAVYSPLNYLPASVGILAGKVLNRSIWQQYMLAKLLQIMAFGALVFFAIKLIPLGKAILFALAFIPHTLNFLTYINADTLTIGFVMLFLALLLRMKLTPPINSPRLSYLPLLLSSLALSLCKVPYCAFALLTLILFKNPRKVPLQEQKPALVISTASLVCMCSWTLFVSGYNPFAPTDAGNVDSHSQLLNILSAPLHFLQLLVNEICEFDYPAVFSGEVPWLKPAPALLYLTVVALIIAVILSPRVELSKLQRTVIVAFPACLWVLIFIIEYLKFTPVGADYIWGVNPRYMLALLPSLLLAAAPGLPAVVGKPRVQNSGKVAVVSLCAMLAVAYCANFWGSFY